MTGCLVLEDGTVFSGRSVAGDGRAFGEAVFTTSMSGYQETVTDPSYAGQIVCFTAPMVGNYGVADQRSQSGAVHATAVVMREVGGSEWTDWLREPRRGGSGGPRHPLAGPAPARPRRMRAAAVAGDPPVDEVLAEVRALPSMEGAALVAGVSPREPYTFAGEGDVRVAVVDYGIQRSLLRLLVSRRARRSTVYPHDVDADTLAALRRRPARQRPGRPGAARRRDRAPCQALLGRAPVLGVCLGHQLLALATGHDTFKLPFGHRGANHPVRRPCDAPACWSPPRTTASRSPPGGGPRA